MRPDPSQGTGSDCRVLIWDLPVRVFHWAFALSIVGALAIALLTSDDSPAFSWHAVFGLTAALLAALRLVWGLIGTRYARFAAMTFSLSEIAGYFARVLTGRDTRHVGHNPGTVVAGFIMLLVVFGLAATGLSLGLGSEATEEIHESLAWGILAVVGMHLAGLAIHTLRFRENIAATMVHGYQRAAPESAIDSPRPGAGMGFLVAAVACLALLSAGRGSSGGTLRLPGLATTLRIGEADGDERGESSAFERDDDD